MDQNNLLADGLAGLKTYAGNFRTNLYLAFEQLQVRDWIRLVWIVGGYIFVRPYIDALFRKWFELGRKKQEDKEKMEAHGGRKAKVSPNALRGGAGAQLDDVDEEEEDGSDPEAGKATGAGGPEWGKSARKRQKKFLKNMEREAERLREEEEDDKDIEDLLNWTDYPPMKS